MNRRSAITLLLLITLGVTLGTLISLYVAATVGQGKLQEAEQTNPLLKLFGL
jgi:hypothetical protein